MVHALQECWRVLRPAGWLLDTRPAGVDRDIEVVGDGRCFHAGQVDVSRGQVDDDAADRAIEAAVRQGLFVRGSDRTYLFSNYWTSVAAARAHIQGRWSDFADVAPEIWTRAEAAVQQLDGVPVQVAIRGEVLMVSYTKA